MQHNLDNIIKFFKYDILVKNILYSVSPDDIYSYSGQQYAKKLDGAIDYVEYYMVSMLNMFPICDNQYVKSFFDTLRFKLDECNYDFYKLKEFYIQSFSSMNTELLNNVAENCVGYKLIRNIDLKKVNSLNELLHVFHQKLVNDENIYQKMPKVCDKKNIEEFNVNLYGENTDLALTIFNSFPYDLSTGDVDIISFDNNFLIMVRDRGHALSLEISRNQDGKYFVQYFIPKICNIDMVNNLVGVDKVDDKSKYTRGKFEIDVQNLPYSIVDFISKVPTDSDIIENGKMYI